MVDEDFPTCEYGFYPYCPLCENGTEFYEDWMSDHQCVWVCYFELEKSGLSFREYIRRKYFG